MQIYVLTDDFYTPQNSLKSQILEILNSGVKFIQFRCKNKKFNLQDLKDIVKICNDFDAKFIINDDVFLCEEINAHGVHLGQDDTDFLEAKKNLDDEKIIGVSCYNNLQKAKNFAKFNASYLAFGAMFKSKIKPNAIRCDFEIVKQAKKLNKKIAVIGGINSQNLPQILTLKPDLIAIITVAYKPFSIKQNLTILNSIIKDFKDKNGNF